MKRAFLLLVVLYFSFSFFASAQKYSIKESSTIVPDYLHEIFFIPSDSRYVIVNYAATHTATRGNREKNFIVTGYNDKLVSSYSTPVTELAGREYEAGMTADNRLFIFSSDNAHRVYKNEINVADGRNIGTSEKLFSFTGDYYSVEKGASPDSSQYFLVFENHAAKEKNNMYQGVILNRQMSVQTKFSFMLSDEIEDVASTKYLLTNDGRLIIISAIKQKASKGSYAPLQYTIKQVGKDGKVQTSVLPEVAEGMFDNVAWRVDNDKLYFTGLLSKSKKADFSSIVTGLYDLSQKKASGVKEIDLGKLSILQNASESYLKDISKEGIPANTELSASFYNSDQSQYLVYEVSTSRFDDKSAHYRMTGGAFGGTSQFGSGTDYSGGDVYVIKLSATNEVEWLQAIGKKQLEQLHRYYIGMAYVKDNKDGLHFVFHDDAENDHAAPQKKVKLTKLELFSSTNLAAVYLSKDGKLNKQPIQSNKGIEHYLSPRQFVSAGNQIIYTSFRHRNLGKSVYRLGSITIR